MSQVQRYYRIEQNIIEQNINDNTLQYDKERREDMQTEKEEKISYEQSSSSDELNQEQKENRD